jgi:hypothetical protein
MIRRLQSGYNGGVGALHSHSRDEHKIRFCSRCEEGYGVQSVLKGRTLGVGESRPADYDLFLQCHNCGQVYAKHETRIEAEIGPIKEPSTGPKGKVQGVEKKDKRKRLQRGSNPRLKVNKWEIKDSELVSELKSGVVLLAYSSTDPTEPTI